MTVAQVGHVTGSACSHRRDLRSSQGWTLPYSGWYFLTTFSSLASLYLSGVEESSDINRRGHVIVTVTACPGMAGMFLTLIFYTTSLLYSQQTELLTVFWVSGSSDTAVLMFHQFLSKSWSCRLAERSGGGCRSRAACVVEWSGTSTLGQYRVKFLLQTLSQLLYWAVIISPHLAS